MSLNETATTLTLLAHSARDQSLEWRRPAQYAALRSLESRAAAGLAPSPRYAARGRPDAGPSLASLDRCPLNGQPHVASGRLRGPGLSIKVRDFGGGDMEVRVGRWRDSIGGPKTGAVEVATETGSRKRVKSDPERAGKRSKQRLRESVRRLKPTAMWTFTKRGKFSSRKEAWNAWAKFLKLMKRRCRKEWMFVAVPELHGDGETWHLHVLVRGFYMVETIRVLWYRALNGRGNERGDLTPGNCDVKPIKPGRYNERRIASYVAAYVGKSITSDGDFKRSYSCAKDIPEPTIAYFNAALGKGGTDESLVIERWAQQAFGMATTRTYWWAREGRSGFIFNSDGPRR